MTDAVATEPEPTNTNRTLRLAVGTAAVVVLMLGTAQFADILGPVFLALNLMIVMWPLQRWLSGHVPRFVAAIVSGLVSLLILAAFFWAIGWAVSDLVTEVPKYKDQMQSFWTSILDILSRFGITSTTLTDQLKGIDPSTITSVVGTVASNVGNVLSLLVVVLSVLIFMIIDSTDFEDRLKRLGEKHNPVLVLALQSFAQGVRRYWVTSTIFGLAVSVLTYFGLLAIGVPLALVWAVLSFVTNYIPNIGFVIGLVPAMLMALLHGGAETGLRDALLVLVLYSVLNFVIQSVIQPKMTGDAVGVTSTVSFLSLLVWAVVLGPLGALLALPATLFVKALLIDADPSARWVNALIAANPKTSQEEPVFDTEEVPNVDPLKPQQAPAPDDSSLGKDPTDDVTDRHRWLETDDADHTDDAPGGGASVAGNVREH